MSELEEFAGPNWVRLYSGELKTETLQQHLDSVIEGAAMRGRCRALEAGWAGLDWKNLARLTLDAYHSARGTARRQQQSNPQQVGEGPREMQS